MPKGKRQKSSNDPVTAPIRARVAKKLPISAAAVEADDNSLFSAARRRYGTWEAAVEAAGFPR